MTRGLIRRAAFAAALAATPAAAEACPPIDQSIAAVMAETAGARADVTERFACHFPPGLTFNQIAILLDRNGFDILNETERAFFRWNLRGEEFTSRRVVPGFWSSAEFRVAIHITDGRLVRFSAQYLNLSRR